MVAILGGEKIFSCLQCGTCGTAWLVSVYMDYTPRRLIRMALGLPEETLGVHKLFVPLTWDVSEKSVAARGPAAALGKPPARLGEDAKSRM